MKLLLDDYRSLPPELQALVAVAVLLDGQESIFYLQSDKTYGKELKAVATRLAQIDPELRMPLLGTLLRETIGAQQEDV